MRPGDEPARVVESVGVGDVPPLARLWRYCQATWASDSPSLEHVAAGVVGGLQVQLLDLALERDVLLELEREHGAQRRALGAEELEVLLDVGDHAGELGAALVAVALGQASPGNFSPQMNEQTGAACVFGSILTSP